MAVDPIVIERGLSLVRAGWTWRAAAVESGVHHTTLRKYAAREGVLPVRRPGQRPVLNAAQVQRLHKQGLAVVDIAAQLGASKTAVLSALDYAGVVRTTRRVRSARAITLVEADALRRALAAGDPSLLARVALDLHAKGVPIAVQSRALDRSRSWLYTRLRMEGYHLPDRHVTGRRPRPEQQ